VASRTPAVYWDTCVFLAWIKDESRTHGEMADLHAVAQEVFQKKLIVISSVIVQTEIEQATLTAGQLERFNKIFDLSNVKLIDMSQANSDKSRAVEKLLQERKRR